MTARADRDNAAGVPVVGPAAVPGPKPWVTYRLADGEPIFGEYAFVTSTEFFDDVDEPTEVIKDTWTLEASETMTFGAVTVEDDDDDEPA